MPNESNASWMTKIYTFSPWGFFLLITHLTESVIFSSLFKLLKIGDKQPQYLYHLVSKYLGKNL